MSHSYVYINIVALSYAQPACDRYKILYLYVQARHVDVLHRKSVGTCNVQEHNKT